MEILGVSASALNYLRNTIIVGTLKPGQKLNENELASNLNISRPPLREALRILEKDRLVFNLARKGTYVTEMSLKDFEELSQVRKMVECYAIDLMEASQICDLAKLNSTLEKSSALTTYDRNDPEQLLEHTRIVLDFHNSLVECSGNLRLVSIYESIRFNLCRYQFIYFNIGDVDKISFSYHRKILKYLSTRKFNEAKEELNKHIGNAMDLVKDELNRSSSK